ncbi:MAG: NUDIX domain-containing protein [Clostridia bacterium]|nr:NUDIX domain-containing protein [Clostridia bacterium]
MKLLFVIDLHDYQENYTVFKRPSARGIIFTEKNQLALVYSKKEQYYKFPGGGIRPNEDIKTALMREIKEEVGLIVIPDSIIEFGSVIRKQKSDDSAETVFEQENTYFWCKTKNKQVEQELDDYEKEADFILRYVDIEEAIDTNQRYHSENLFDEITIKREMKVLQIIKAYRKDHRI